MRKAIVFIGLFLLWVSCDKEVYFDGEEFYVDDFESYESTEAMVKNTEENWSYIQITEVENELNLDTTFFHSGNQSIRFKAKESVNGTASKCSIAKQNVAFWEGDTVRISAWYFMEGEELAEWLFLMDLEERTAVGAGPGMRLAVVNNQIRVEYKFLEDDILQNGSELMDFPRNQWVELVFEVHLSSKYEGYVKLWQNGTLIIDSKENRTLPRDFLYFQQGTKQMYGSVEIGITANTEDNPMTMWVDDFKIEKVN